MAITSRLFPHVPPVAICGNVDLVGTAEVAVILGVSRQQVDRLANQPGFPEPVTVIKAGRIWRRRDIERWHAAHPVRRPGPPPKPYPPTK